MRQHRRMDYTALDAGDPEAALRLLDEFMASLGADAGLLALFEQ